MLKYIAPVDFSNIDASKKKDDKPKSPADGPRDQNLSGKDAVDASQNKAIEEKRVTLEALNVTRNNFLANIDATHMTEDQE